jgi:hypothetical protein
MKKSTNQAFLIALFPAFLAVGCGKSDSSSENKDLKNSANAGSACSLRLENLKGKNFASGKDFNFSILESKDLNNEIKTNKPIVRYLEGEEINLGVDREIDQKNCSIQFEIKLLVNDAPVTSNRIFFIAPDASKITVNINNKDVLLTPKK